MRDGLTWFEFIETLSKAFGVVAGRTSSGEQFLRRILPGGAIAEIAVVADDGNRTVSANMIRVVLDRLEIERSEFDKL